MVGITDRVIAEAGWNLNGENVSTGTVTIRWWRWNGSTRQYLQSDGTTWGASAHEFAATYDATEEAWRHNLVHPEPAGDYDLAWQMTHSNAALPPITGSEPALIGTGAQASDCPTVEEIEEHLADLHGDGQWDATGGSTTVEVVTSPINLEVVQTTVAPELAADQPVLEVETTEIVPEIETTETNLEVED